MRIGGVGFRYVFVASGALNFFGQGYKQHKVYRKLFRKSFCFDNTTFIAKTTTLEKNQGAVEYRGDYQIKSLFPGWMIIKFFRPVILNAMELPGPGAEKLFQDGRWQERKKPFFISFAPIKSDPVERRMETEKFVVLCKRYFPKMKATVGVQINLSCPNDGVKTKKTTADTMRILQAFESLKVPKDLKISALTSIETIKEVENSGLCDILTCFNSIPYGAFDEDIPWEQIFDNKISQSPLEKRGFKPGGLSGYDAHFIVLEKILEIRNAGITMPIKATSIFHPRHVQEVVTAGVQAIEVGATAVICRPWRVVEIIKIANKLFPMIS